MTDQNLVADLERAIAELPSFDVHTHLVGGRLGARGLHDILLYHMVVSDLYAAGCPSGARLTQYPGWPDEDEAHARLQEAMPYLPLIRNTSCCLVTRMILADLYGWNEPVTADNWQRLDAMIREKADDRALALLDLRPAEHPPHLHRARPAGRGRGRRAAAILAGMGLFHPLPMGRVRYGPLRIGALLGAASRQSAIAHRRPAAGHATA